MQHSSSLWQISQRTYTDFYNEYYEKVFYYLKRHCSSYQDAEDLTGQVFLYCYEHWVDYDPGRASAATWVFMIARSRLINFYRDRKNNVNIDDLAETLTIDDSDIFRVACEIHALRDQLADAMNKLPEKDRQLIILRYFTDTDAHDIANKLGMSYGAMRVALSRALKKLAVLMGDVE